MIQSSQGKHSHKLPKDESLDQDGEGLFRMKGKVGILSEDINSQVRILVVTHCRKAEHRSTESTLGSIREEFV